MQRISLLKAETEGLKSLLMKVKEESEKTGLNSTFKKLRSWHLVSSLHGQTDRETMETVTDFILGGSKITADVTVDMKLKDACSLEEKL